MKFRKLVAVFDRLEGLSSRNEMRRVLAGLFADTPKPDLDSVAYLLLGRIDAEYKKVDLGLAEKMMIRALEQTTGRTAAEVSALAKTMGDLGSVARKIVRGRGSLSVKDVIDKLRAIAAAGGAGSQETKLRLISDLLEKSSPTEAKYIVRIALGYLRMGIGSPTIFDALSLAFKGEKSEAELRSAYEKTSDIGLVALLAASKGPSKIGVTVGVPVKMMLAQRAKSWEELRARFPGFVTAEEKYDGERMQVHKIRGEFVVFSRRLERITHQYPDVLAALKRSIDAESCIVEGEVVAVDRQGRLLPFQTLMPRRRKHGTEQYVKKIPVSLFLFDLLYLNGKSYVDALYPDRRNLLERIVRPSRIVRLARQVRTDDFARIRAFFKQCLDRGAEGIILKSNAKDSVYQAGTRGWLWIKWKKEYAAGAVDTYDLVIVGAYAGRGLRAGTYGSLLCAVYNDARDRFETFTKLGAGFSDRILADLPKILARFQTKTKPARVEIKKAMEPDVYFEPGAVIEVLGSEVTVSPSHSSGYALRFPRLIRFRDDKSPEQATTAREITAIAGKGIRERNRRRSEPRAKR
jgi:DNA ligase-1